MLKVINPATDAVLADVPVDDPGTFQSKMVMAMLAQQTWAGRPLTERLGIIRRFRTLLVDRKETLAQKLTSEVGKPITQSRNEIEGTLGRIDFFLEKVPQVLSDEIVLKDPAQRLEEKITFEPLGMIVNISAWNYPYFVGSNVFLPALLTGNAVLYKPSEFATLTGLAIGELLKEAGLPDGVFTVFTGGGDVGAELLKKRVGGVFFTGSYATGKKIAEAVAGRMIRVQLELGGKDPVYVCDDVDVKAAAEATADGAFYNTGQSCCAVERIYVHRKIHEPFVAAFLKTVQGFKIGDPTDPATYIGPLARAVQVAVLEDQVADAVAKGARLLCGGKRMDRPGNYFEPTVLLDAKHDMKVMRDESFGPIIGIMAVDGDEDALKLMQDTEYGLTAGVYSKDRARAERILARVNTGTVYWNCCDRVSPRLPWSGRGHSGIGTTLSTTGIQAFLQPKAWHLRG
jgi:acyl-CoA reductase-like NAD-dependent aldehyde dehydrogenase